MDELIGLFGVSEEDGYEHSYEAQMLSSAAKTTITKTNSPYNSNKFNINQVSGGYNNTCAYCVSHAQHVDDVTASEGEGCGNVLEERDSVEGVKCCCPVQEGAAEGSVAGSSGGKTGLLHVEAEVEEGNVEFKLKLVNPTESRLEHLITQMKWRLREGHGEAIYQIGVEDSGALLGLCEAELEISLGNLYKMAQRLNSHCTILREVIIDDLKKTKAVEVLVRKIPSDRPFIDMRVCMLGNVDCGKSSLVGVLTTRQLDSGRGRARLNLLRHPHEIETGHTSSVCHEILGFDSQGQAVDYSVVRNKEEICESSSKLVTFIDLPGCQRSLKTTIFGLTGYYPDYSLVLVAANQGIVDTTRDHFALALALNIPCAIVVTKCDLLGATGLAKLDSQIKSVLQLPGVGKMCLFVRENQDAVQAASPAALNSDCIIPVFRTSCVTGEGMDLLKVFLNILPRKNHSHGNGYLEEDPLVATDGPLCSSVDPFAMSSLPADPAGGAECCDMGGIAVKEPWGEATGAAEADADFKIDETYVVPNVGCVVAGILRRGVIRKGDRMSLGPYEDGEFKDVYVCSLHRSGRVPCTIIRNNQAAAVAIKPQYPVRKGMVLLASFAYSAPLANANTPREREDSLSTFSEPGRTAETAISQPLPRIFKASVELEAEVLILFHPTKVTTGFQCTLHIDNIVQSAVIKRIVSTTSQDQVAHDDHATTATRVQTRADNNPSFPSSDAAMLTLTPPTTAASTTTTTTTSAAAAISKSAPQPSTGAGKDCCLSTNEKGQVTFRFVKQCEYVRPGMRLVLRHGKSKAIGHITKVYPYHPNTP